MSVAGERRLHVVWSIGLSDRILAFDGRLLSAAGDEMMKVLERLIWPVAMVECVAIIATGAYLGLRNRPAAARVGQCETICSSQASAAGQCEKDEPIVIVVRGDRFYHRRSCRYVGSSKRAMPMSRAWLHHRPCSRCKPPH